MADYNALIDAEIWAFIQRTAAHYPDETATYGAADQRRIYDAMAAAFHAGRPDGVEVADEVLGGVPARRYRVRAPAATCVYLHGGGFVVGGLESHDDVCAELAVGAEVEVVSVDYRLCPEHRHPAQFDDAYAAAAAEAAKGPVILAGDSAGGCLAAAVAHAARGAFAVLGQVLIYPGLGGDFDAGSYLEQAEAPMLTRADILAYRHLRFAGAEPVGDPTYAPLHDQDFAGLPPTVILSAECDPLCDDGRDYQRRIEAAGGRAVWLKEAGLVHGHLRARHMSVRAAASFERVKRAISAFAKGDWPALE